MVRLKQLWLANLWLALLPRLTLLLALLLAHSTLAQTTSTYVYTGNTDSYVVPAGVTQLTVVATGANNGAIVQATVAVTPGENLTVVVGGGGHDAHFGPSGGGSGPTYLFGYNGGGNSGYYNPLSGISFSVGGGATDLRRNGARTSDYLVSRNALLVAGGGGSGCTTDSGNNYPGGSGGTPTGGNGSGTGVGGGASQTGVGSSSGGTASNNVGGIQGTNYGGSGGGGYYGGGSGTSSGTTDLDFRAGGGGGGSSWIAAGSTGTFSLSTAYPGSMTITPVQTPTPTLTAPANGSIVATATPTYSGTATASSTVRLYVDGSSTPFTTTATSGGTFSFAQPTALGQGSHAVYVTAQSGSLLVSVSSATATFTVDTVAPTATLSTTASNPTATSPIPFTVMFSEGVTGFGAGGLLVTGGTLTGGTVSGTSGGTTYTFTVTPAGNGAVVGVSVRAGAAQDAAGNGNPATGITSVTYSVTPTISGFTPVSGPVGQSVTVSGNNLNGATAVTVNGVAGTITGTPTAGSLTFTVGAGSTSGLISLTTPGGTATSTTGFTVVPAPTITSFSPTNAATGAVVTVRGTAFAGATALTVGGTGMAFTLVNGTTITFVVPVNGPSGLLSVTTPGGTATSSGTLTVDNIPPTAALSTPANPTSDPHIPFTATFSEPVTGFGAGGISVSNGTVTPGSVSGSGTTYTFTITPASSGPAAVVVDVRVLANAAQDAAGNPNPATSITSVTYVPPPDLTNTGTLLTVQAGGILYVGTIGLRNQAGTLANGGALRVDGPLANPAAATLALSAGTLEVRGDMTNAGTLTPGTSAVTFSGADDQLLTPGGATLYQVVVNKPTAGANTLRLAGDLTISNALTLTAGNVSTRAGGPGTPVSTLRLPAGATLSGEASGRYVRGLLAITRPNVGGAAVDFGHGVVLDPTSNTLGTVTVTRAAGLLLDDVSRATSGGRFTYRGIDRIWTVSAAAQPTAAVQLTLSWLPDDDNGLTNFVQAHGWHQPASGQPWTEAGPLTNAGSRFITLSPTSFSRFTVSNGANPLPVTLLDFTAAAEGPAAARLRWATAQEVDNAGFTVERSPDGVAFAAVGTVAGSGSSAARHDYTLLDARLPAGSTLLYYRLRQTDRAGTASYSTVRAVAFAPLAAGFVVFPTRVAAGQLVSYLYTGPTEAGTLTVLNVLGQVLHTAALAGRPTGPVPLAGLATGVYFLRYTGPAGRFTSRLVVE